MEKKRLILSAGGTGGHLFPAQALATQLEDVCEILFVAGGLSTSRYFDRDVHTFHEIQTATFSFSKPWQLVPASLDIWRGVRESHSVLHTFKPHGVVGFGSFYTLPLLTAARQKGVPIFLHEQNARPGKVNRLFSSAAKATAITFPESASRLKGNCIEVAFPKRAPPPETDPWTYFGLTPGKTTLLVYGGSQGARRLNHLFLQAASKLPFQILHFTGTEEMADEACRYYTQIGVHAVVKRFETRMDLALQCADLCLTRAGAGTITELIEAKKPALLVPFPFAADNHQVDNGAHFVRTVGGGEMVLEEELTQERLVHLLNRIATARNIYRKNIEVYVRERTVEDFAKLIMEEL